MKLRILPSKKSKRGPSPTAQRTENDMDDEDDVDVLGNLFDSNETGDSWSGLAFCPSPLPGRCKGGGGKGVMA